MPKLPRVTSREIVRVLQRLGYVAHHQTGSHQVFYHPLKRQRIVVPMHNRELGVGLARTILRQAGVTPTEFRNLLNS